MSKIDSSQLATFPQGSGLLPVERLGLWMVMLIPVLPRPTHGAFALALAAGWIVLILYLAALQGVSLKPNSQFTGWPADWFVILLAATTFYAGRSYWSGSGSEWPFVASRILLVATVVAMYLLLRRGDLEKVLRMFLVGVVVLSALVTFIGVTGANIFEMPRPARTMGVSLPWFKTAGVPRSYGEQGIIVSVAVAYLLCFWRSLSPWTKYVGVAACLALLLAGQSRTMLLAAVVVLLASLVRHRSRLLGSVLICAALSTAIVERLLPALSQTVVGSALIGQDTFERNVSVRFSLLDQAYALISTRPWRALLGFDHADWTDYTVDVAEAGTHNHFAASLLFLGILGGAATIWCLYVAPLWLVLTSLHDVGVSPEELRLRRMVLVSFAGILTCLNFYEGFFSLALSLMLALLWLLAHRAKGFSRLVGRGPRARVDPSAPQTSPTGT